MKLKKAKGGDGIPMEAWKYASESVRIGLTELLNQIWKEKKIPEDWKKSIIVLLYKREDKEEEITEGYRCYVRHIRYMPKY